MGADNEANEVWEPLDNLGYPKYEVNTYGEVRHKKFKNKLNAGANSRGYYYVGLNDVNGKSRYVSVANLVIRTFGTAPEEENMQIQHLDGNYGNNNIDNLVWKSRRAIAKEAGVTGKKKRVRCVETGKVYESIGDAAKDIGRDRTSLGRALKDARKTSGGFHWEYAE